MKIRILQAEKCSRQLKLICFDDENAEMSDLADLISLKSINSKPEFSANDYFPIDMTLLFAVSFFNCPSKPLKNIFVSR